MFGKCIGISSIHGLHGLQIHYFSFNEIYYICWHKEKGATWSTETITAGQERLKQMQESLFGRQSNGGDDVRTPRFKVKEAPVVLKASISWYQGENHTGYAGLEILERKCAPESLRIVSATFGICRVTIE